MVKRVCPEGICSSKAIEMSSSFPSIRAKIREISSSSQCRVELVELQRPLEDGCTAAVKKTLFNPNFPDQYREISIYSLLNGFPGLFPRMYGYMERAGLSEFLIEHFPGGNLLQHLTSRGDMRCSRKRLQQIVTDSTQALAQLHKLRISHRNISLSAIQLSTSGYKLGGDYSQSVLHASRTPEDAFASDVLELGLCFVQVVLLNPSIRQTDLYTAYVQNQLKQSLRRYSEMYAELIVGMTCQDTRERWSAAKALQYLTSQSVLNESGMSVDDSTIPPINTPRSMRIPRIAFPSVPSPAPQPRPTIRPAHEKEFNRHRGKLLTEMEMAHLEGNVLKDLVADFFEFLTRSSGEVQVQLESDLFRCDLCHMEWLDIDKAVLPICHHMLCKNCLNTHVSKILSLPLSTRPLFTCPIDNEPFDPFDSEVQPVLDPFIIKKLDEEMQQGVACPKCNTLFDCDAPCAAEPVNILCIGCRFEFCSFCSKKGHAHYCELWRQKFGRRKP